MAGCRDDGREHALMCYEQMGEMWNDTAKIDPMAKLAKGQMEMDSRAMESLGKRWNIPMLERDAKANQEKPEEGIARAAVATGTAMLGNWLGATGGAAAGAGATAAEQAALTASEKAAEEMMKQMALEAAQGGMTMGSEVVPKGLMNTMEAGLMDTGYTPSNLYQAFKNGPGSGQGMGQTMQNYGKGLMDRVTSPGARQAASKRYAMKQATGLMNPEQPQQAPTQRYQQPQQEPMPLPYDINNLSEEEKMRLRMKGYRI